MGVFIALATALVVLTGAAYTVVAILFGAAIFFFDDTGEPPSQIYWHWLLLFAPVPLFGAAIVAMFSAIPSFAGRLLVGLLFWSAALLSVILLFTLWSETWSH
jgi:hypothetical protein